MLFQKVDWLSNCKYKLVKYDITSTSLGFSFPLHHVMLASSKVNFLPNITTLVKKLPKNFFYCREKGKSTYEKELRYRGYYL